MKKAEFINYLLALYGKFLDPKQKQLWTKDAFDVLEDNIDYTKFRLYFLHEFESKTISNIPSPQWLYRESRQFIKQKQNYKILEQIKSEPPGIPCPPEIKARINNILSNRKQFSLD